MKSPLSESKEHGPVKIPLSPADGGIRKIRLNLLLQREILNFPPLEKGDPGGFWDQDYFQNEFRNVSLTLTLL